MGMLSLRLMPTMPMLVLAMAMLDMAMLVLAMLLLMPTTERGLLMLSPRLMLVISMELMDMLLPTPMVPTPMPMVATPMPPTDMASKMSSTPHQSRPPSTNAEAQKQTKYLIKFDIQCLYKSFVI